MQEALEIKKEKVCLNCGALCEGEFCPQCGQRTDTGKFNWPQVFQNIGRGLFSADRGVFYTVQELFHRPGNLIVSFVEGKRVRWFPPFSLLFFVATAYAIVDSIQKAVAKKAAAALLQNKETADVVKDFVDSKAISGAASSGKGLELSLDILTASAQMESQHPVLSYLADFVSNNYGLLIVFSLPLFVIALRGAFGKRFRHTYNWAETFMLSAYIVVQIVLVLTVLGLVTLAFPSFDDASDFIFMVSCIGLLQWDIRPITGFSCAKGVRRSILAGIFFILLLMLVIIFVALAAMGLYALFQ